MVKVHSQEITAEIIKDYDNNPVEVILWLPTNITKRLHQCVLCNERFINILATTEHYLQQHKSGFSIEL